MTFYYFKSFEFRFRRKSFDRQESDRLENELQSSTRTGRERTMSAQNASTRPEITLVRVNSVIERRAPFRRSASFSVICAARRRYILILHVVEQQENDRTRIFSSHKIAVTTFYLCSSFFYCVFLFFQRFPRAGIESFVAFLELNLYCFLSIRSSPFQLCTVDEVLSLLQISIQ